MEMPPLHSMASYKEYKTLKYPDPITLKVAVLIYISPDSQKEISKAQAYVNHTFLFVQDSVSLCSPVCPGTHYVDL